jgi:hypothetical protein
MRIKKNDDDTFYIKVNKGLMPKKTANYPISIGLEDDRGEINVAKVLITVEVTIIDKKAEANKAEDENDEKGLADNEENDELAASKEVP